MEYYGNTVKIDVIAFITLNSCEYYLVSPGTGLTLLNTLYILLLYFAADI